MTISENPVSEDQRFQWSQIRSHVALEMVSDLCRHLDAYGDEHVDELTARVWAIFGEAYEAGRLNPREIQPEASGERA